MKRGLAILTVAAVVGAFTAASAASNHKPVLGVTTSPAAAPAWSAALATPVGVLANFISWSKPFRYADYLSTVPDAMTPMITWQPDPAGGNAAIAAGNDDPFILQTAQSMAAYGRPIYLRYAHEMNGNWYPWSQGPPATYVAAWRHVYTLFRSAGANNVRFIWSPNAAGQTTQSFLDSIGPYWPGRRYVNRVGVTTIESHGSVNRYLKELDALHAAYPRKPVTLPEFNGITVGWVSDFATAIRARPWISVLVWYEKPAYGSLLQHPDLARALQTALR